MRGGRSDLARGPRLARGVTVLDTLVGLGLGMTLVASLALLFAHTSRSAQELTHSLRHIENARLALDLLAEDLSLAGYYGTAVAQPVGMGPSACTADPAEVAGLLNGGAGTVPTVLPWPVQGFTAQDATALGCLPDLQPGTPALLLRRVDTQALPASQAPSDQVVLQASHFRDDLQPLVASANGQGLGLRDRSGQPAEVRRWLQRVYFVARCSDCSGSGDGLPTLKRLELGPAGRVVVPLVEGIEQVTWDFGLDSSGDGVPDTWLGLGGGAGAAESAAVASIGWAQVVAVRIALLARALEPSPGHQDTATYPMGLRGSAPVLLGPFNDSYKRRGSTRTARLHTIAGLRERP